MKTKRYLVAGLALSLAVNLVLVGMLAGSRIPLDTGMKRVDPMLGIRRLLDELPEQRAEALRPYLRGYFSSLRPRFRELRGSQQSLRVAMLSDPLDTEALSAALASFNSHLFESQQQSHEPFVALAAALSLKEREQLVALLNEPPRRRERPGAGNHPPPPPGR